MITLDNYESYLFLYQEGELDSATRTEVERFLLQHPDIREEMETYYDPTFVVTAEPPIRHARRARPLWRWAAAACVVLALGYGAFLTFPSSSENSSLLADASHPSLAPSSNHTTDPLVLYSKQHPSIVEPISKPVQKRIQYSPISTTMDEQPNTATPTYDEQTSEQETEPIVEIIINEPSFIASNNLAQLDEIIIVDDIVREIPNAKPSDTPPVTYLAMRIKRGLENRRLEFEEFVYRVFVSKSDTNVLAEAN